MRISTHVCSDFFTNCYVLQDEGTGRTAVIDPGEVCDTLCEQIGKIGAEYIDYILLTHCHLDHILGAAELHRMTGAPVVIHMADAPGLGDNDVNGISQFCYPALETPEADIIVHDSDTLALGDLTLRVLHTPGHTIGSVCFITEDVIFSGDTLFRMSCGRVDLPTGSGTQILASLEKIAALAGDFRVYPGHGEPTTLDFERENNRYIHIPEGN